GSKGAHVALHHKILRLQRTIIRDRHAPSASPARQTRVWGWGDRFTQPASPAAPIAIVAT
ncbi:MAG: hypothetical protein AAGB02_09125, partial [Pseudomonadota bacterium]